MLELWWNMKKVSFDSVNIATFNLTCESHDFTIYWAVKIAIADTFYKNRNELFVKGCIKSTIS